MSVQDFIRPDGAETGILLNNNNDALSAYKKSKMRMKKVDILEEELKNLTRLVMELQERINDSTSS